MRVNIEYLSILEVFKEKNLKPAFTEENFDKNKMSFLCNDCGREEPISLRNLRRLEKQRKCWYCDHRLKGTTAEKLERLRELLQIKGIKVQEPFIYPKGDSSFEAFCKCGEKVEIKVRYLWDIKEGAVYRCKKCVSLIYADSGEEIQKRFLEKGATPLFLPEDYINRDSILKFKCKCGKKDVTAWNTVRDRNIILCDKCRHQSKRLDTNYVKKMFRLANKEPLFDEHVSGRIPVLCRCKSCNAEYKISVYDIIKQVNAGKPSCRNCETKKRRHSEETIFKLFYSKGLTPLFSYSEYKCRTTRLKVKCSCGKIIYRSVSDLNCSGLCAECQFKYTQVRGENHGMYNPLLKREKYDSYLQTIWKKELKRFFNNRCFITKTENKPLIAHHIRGRSIDVLNLFNVANGILMLPELHTDFHKVFGFGKNDEKQLKQWFERIGEKYKLRQIQKDSNFFIYKQPILSDFYHFCSRLKVKIIESVNPYLLTLQDDTGKSINIFLIKTNKKATSTFLSQATGCVAIFEQEFIDSSRRKAWFRELKYFFKPTEDLESVKVKKMKRSEVNSFLHKYSLEKPLTAGFYYGCFSKGKLIAVTSFRRLKEHTYASYQLVSHCYKSPANKDVTLKAVVKALKQDRAPVRILLEFNKRYDAFKPVFSAEYEPVKDVAAEVFYAKNSFDIFPESLFKRPTGVKFLQVYDPEMSLEDNLHFNRYYRIKDLGRSRFLYQKTKRKVSPFTSLQSIPKATPIELPDKTQEIAERYVENYYENGFPYYKFTEFEKMQIFHDLQAQPPILQGNRLERRNHGQALLWSYFPHSWEISCNGRMTAMELFQNRELFLTVLKDNLQKRSKLTDSQVRAILSSSMGVKTVSNFRPLAAKALYDMFAGEGVVYDMCAGFGGRMLGAILSDKVKTYIGVEPSNKTFEGLSILKQELGRGKNIELKHSCAEDIFTPPEFVDFCFTSPPYFNCELYAKEPTQSCIRYKTKKEWMDKFFRKMIQICHHALKPEGYLAINIANVSSFKNLVEVANEVILRQGFVLHSKMKYIMNSFGKNREKYEPIFIYNKKPGT